MKKFVGYMIVLMALVFNSCEQEQETFQESLLIGKWSSGTLHYQYASNYTGTTWDTADDVTEAEAQAFTWTLVQSELTHIHIIETGGSLPKVYTVTELTATSLKYKDGLGKTYSFNK
ncbi:MAG TPA: hypothetical protein VGK10_07495 [Prolixibacteraceae bacterium]|jgi:hypothetical protein